MIILSDLRFGQTGGWDSPDAPFIFNYTIFQDASGKVHITRARPPFNKADFNRMFSSLFARIKGRSDVKPENAG